MTAVEPPKFVPVITTVEPKGPLAGERLMTVGAGIGVKLPALVAVPPGVATVIGPVVAPEGTVAVICVDESAVKTALVPLNSTELAAPRLLPVTTTLVPAGPLLGEKLAIDGG